MKIFDKTEITRAFNFDSDLETLLQSQRQAFIDFSHSKYTVPSPMQLRFPQVNGECHVKAGSHTENGASFVIKIAGGFYNNITRGLPSSDGLMLVFCKTTGVLQTILHDEGWFTSLRTACAALLAASLTPWATKRIGIIGTGSVAKLLLALIQRLYPYAQVSLWGRNSEKTKQLAPPNSLVCTSIPELLKQSDLVISCTASCQPIIENKDVIGNSHIVALGSDDSHKQECDPRLFARADTIIVDCIKQASALGDTAHALRQRYITEDRLLELGLALEQTASFGPQLMITDLTGIGAQDVAIAEFISARL